MNGDASTEIWAPPDATGRPQTPQVPCVDPPHVMQSSITAGQTAPGASVAW